MKQTKSATTTDRKLTPAEERFAIEQAINLVKGSQRHKISHENCECLADIWRDVKND